MPPPVSALHKEVHKPSFSHTQDRETRGETRGLPLRPIVRHRANRGLVGHEPRKVGTDVSGAVLVPIERNHAVSLCAAPQTPYSLSRLLLHLGPWTALPKTSTAC